MRSRASVVDFTNTPMCVTSRDHPPTTLGQTVIGLPFSLYSTFVVEAKHGFNKQTIGLFFADKVRTIPRCWSSESMNKYTMFSLLCCCGDGLRLRLLRQKP